MVRAMKQMADYYLTVDQSLRNFAGLLSRTLGGIEFRHSNNEEYVNEECFQAREEGLEFTLSYCDDERAENFRFWLQVKWESAEPRENFLAGLEKTLFLGLSAYEPEIAQVVDLRKRSQKIFLLDYEDVMAHEVEGAFGEDTAEQEGEDEQREYEREESHREVEECEEGNRLTKPDDRFAVLQVVDIQEIGAFLDWGQPKDLFLPHSEQTRPIRVGQDILICIYADKQDRPTATMRFDRHLSKEPPTYKENQEVDLIITAKTDLGYKAVINQSHWGMLYHDEVFQQLHYGQRTKGYIRKVREDLKIDLLLQAPGHKAAQLGVGPKILSELENAKGFLNINDKTSAEQIYEMFGVSKKKYKIALGDLYKKRLIAIDDNGIRLLKK